MKKKRGCIRPVLFIILAVFLLYFLVGEGRITLLKMAYPVKYQEVVEKCSEEYNLDRFLVYSVINVESRFNEKAVSRVGAKGLMQLMDKTAQECNKRENFGYNIPDDLFNPETNIRIGCSYLRKLIDTHKDLTLAVTAYNAGTGNVKKWLSDNELSDGEGGLADIPYPETKRYVDKVFRNYNMYSKIYKEGSV